MTTALLKFGQDGGATGGDGQAFVYDTAVGSYVSIGNSAGGGTISSWRIELLYAPPGSPIEQAVGGPQPGVPEVLAENSNDSTPAYDITPDSGYYGCYRIKLTVWSGPGYTGLVDMDIRNIGVPTPNSKYIIPPYQDLPEPLPVLGSGETGEKPDEMNFEGQVYGWDGADGSATHRQLYAALLHLDSLAGAIIPPATPAQDNQLCFANAGVQDYTAGITVLNVGGAEDGLQLTDIVSIGDLNLQGVDVWVYGANSIMLDDGVGFVYMEAGEVYLGDVPLIFQDYGSANIFHQDDTSSGASGQNFTLHAQDTTGGSGNTGGNMVLRGGNATGGGAGATGAVILQDGASAELVRFDDGGGAPRVLLQAALLWAASVTPHIWQQDDVATDANGDTFLIAAQDCPNGSSSYGGDMVLQTGFGNHVFGAGELTVKLGGASGLSALVVRRNQIVITPSGQQQYLQLGGSTTEAEAFFIQGQYQGTSSTTGGGDIAVIGGNSGAIRGGSVYLVGGAGGTTADGGNAYLLGGELSSGTGEEGSAFLGIAGTANYLVLNVKRDELIAVHHASTDFSFYAAPDATVSAAGNNFYIHAQDTTGGTGNTGGNLILRGGNATGSGAGALGAVILQSGAGAELIRFDDDGGAGPRVLLPSAGHIAIGVPGIASGAIRLENDEYIRAAAASTGSDLIGWDSVSSRIRIGGPNQPWTGGLTMFTGGGGLSVADASSGANVRTIQIASNRISFQHNDLTPTGAQIDCSIGPSSSLATFNGVDLTVFGGTSAQAGDLNGGSLVLASGAGWGTGADGSVRVVIGAASGIGGTEVGVFGLDTEVYLGLGTNYADSGILRLPNAKVIVGSNTTNDGNIELIQASTLNRVQVGASASLIDFYAGDGLSFQVGSGYIRAWQANWNFATQVVSPLIQHNADTAVSAAGDTFLIHAQDTTGGSGNTGGDLVLRGGNATGSGAGALGQTIIQDGAGAVIATFDTGYLGFGKSSAVAIKLEDRTTDGDGATLSLIGQDGYGTSYDGGNVDIQAGAPGAGGVTGVVNLKGGSATLLTASLDYISNECALRIKEDSVSGDPASGYAYLWVDSGDGQLKVKFDNGAVVAIAQP